MSVRAGPLRTEKKQQRPRSCGIAGRAEIAERLAVANQPPGMAAALGGGRVLHEGRQRILGEPLRRRRRAVGHFGANVLRRGRQVGVQALLGGVQPVARVDPPGRQNHSSDGRAL